MLEMSEVEGAIAAGDAAKLADLIEKYQLELDGDCVKASKEVQKRYEDFWDRRQLIRKILLNS
jgi:hypothetical protein